MVTSYVYFFATSIITFATRAVASVIATLFAFSAIANNVSLSHCFRVCAMTSGVKSFCSIIRAAPAFSNGRAFQYCCLSLCWKGTKIAGNPAAAISLTVNAPERHTTTSAHW